MKKLILTGVLALGFGLMSFKSETEEIKEEFKKSPYECFISADHEATNIGFIQGLSYQDEYTVFMTLYEECIG